MKKKVLIMSSKNTLLEISTIVAEVEKEVKQIYDESHLEKAIANDVILSKRNMAYNKIKSLIDKYNKTEEN